MATDNHHDTLHLAAWNLNHRTGRKAISPAVIHSLPRTDGNSAPLGTKGLFFNGASRLQGPVQ